MNSYTIIRRFTPPTCTLEIWGKNSSLSRWAKKTVVKNIKFKLSFDDPRNLDKEPLIIEGDRDKLEQIYNIVLNHTDNFLAQSFTNKPFAYSSVKKEINTDNKPYLISQGLTSHQFNLGNLITDSKFSNINLSATQLFDLVSALEEYKTEMSALTQLETKVTKSSKILPIGLSVAGILLAIGITTAGIRVANQTEEQEKIAAQQAIESQVNDSSPLEKVVPPEIPEIAEKPTTIAKENNPLSSTEKLPPPPPVDSPKPPPNIPDPAKYPPLGNITIPPISSAPIQIPNQNESSSNSQSPEDNSQVESTIAVNPEKTTETAENNELEITANENANIDRNEIIIDGENSEVEEQINQRSELNASGNRETIIQEENEIKENIINSKKDIANNNIPKPSSEETVENQPESKIPQNIQLQEVKSYFNQKWQSPEGLKQTLEYRLIINQNGSINRIIPIGKASEIYLDRTNIPLMGEPFVSPLENDSAIIRLLLSPDGEVRTFLE